MTETCANEDCDKPIVADGLCGHCWLVEHEND